MTKKMITLRYCDFNEPFPHRKEKEIKFEDISGGIRVKDLIKMLKELNPNAICALEYDGNDFPLHCISLRRINTVFGKDFSDGSFSYKYTKSDVVQPAKDDNHNVVLFE